MTRILKFIEGRLEKFVRKGGNDCQLVIAMFLVLGSINPFPKDKFQTLPN